MAEDVDVAAAVERIMIDMDFYPGDTGPFVTELRARIERKVRERGLRSVHMCWGDEADPELRAKAALGWEWAADRRHTCRVRCIDGFRWAHLGEWLLDCRDRFGMRWRVFRDRHVLRVQNPYR